MNIFNELFNLTCGFVEVSDVLIPGLFNDSVILHAKKTCKISKSFKKCQEKTYILDYMWISITCMCGLHCLPVCLFVFVLVTLYRYSSQNIFKIVFVKLGKREVMHHRTLFAVNIVLLMSN